MVTNENVMYGCFNSLFVDRKTLQVMGVAYFLYLLLFSGLEYSLTFLCHQMFNYTR